MDSRAILVTGVNQVSLGSFPVRELQTGETLVEADYTCISPGTELRVLVGGQPPPGYPYIPGYAVSGRVLACCGEPAWPAGTRVFSMGTLDAGPFKTCYGAHAHRLIVPSGSLVPVPAGVDTVEASATILGAIALRGLRMSRPLVGETVLVVGLGVIGQLSARLHALAGAKVIGCDRSAARVACARAAGVDAVVVETGLKAALGDRLGAGADIVVDATGVAAVIPGAMSLAKHVPLTDAEQPFTRYLLQGSYGGDVTFPYHGAFAKQLSILVPKAHQPRDRFTIMELLARGRLRLRDLISAVRPPEAASATYAELQDPRTSLLTVAFAWE